MRDCATISATHKALDTIGCKVYPTLEIFEGWEDAQTF